MGDKMLNSWAKPIQFEDNGVRIYLRPKVYYPNNNYAQLITFPYVTSIPVDYNEVLTCIVVCKPTK